MAGNTNVSLSFEGRTAGGLAASRRASFLAAPGKAPRQFQVYPVVQSLRPTTGSVAGGTLVTIAGRGFPSFSMPGNNAITQLLVGGVPCQVVASNFSSITCRTQPQPSAPQPAVMACSANGTVAAASNDTSNSTAAGNTTSSSNSSSSTGGQSCFSGSIGSLFPGMRGVMYEQFNRYGIECCHTAANHAIIRKASSYTCMPPAVWLSACQLFVRSSLLIASSEPGMLADHWAVGAIACRTVGYSQLGEVLQNWTLNFTAGDASAVLGAAWESPTIEAVSFCTRSRAFFTAVNPGRTAGLCLRSLLQKKGCRVVSVQPLEAATSVLDTCKTSAASMFVSARLVARGCYWSAMELRTAASHMTKHSKGKHIAVAPQ